MGNNDSSGDSVELMDVLNLSTCKCQENKTVNPKLVRTWWYIIYMRKMPE